MACEQRKTMPTLIAVYGQAVRSPTVRSIYLCSRFDEECPVHIGRCANPGLHLPHDSAVSEVHAVVRRVGDRFLLQDSGSTNGTEIIEHGARVPLFYDLGPPLVAEQHELRDGERFVVGETVVFFSTNDMTEEQVVVFRDKRHAEGLWDASSLLRRPRKGKGNTYKTDAKSL